MNEPKAKYYWKIKTKTENIWVHADSVKVDDYGCVLLYKEDQLVFAMRGWEYVGAASVFTGDLVYIEHWDKIKDTPEPPHQN